MRPLFLILSLIVAAPAAAQPAPAQNLPASQRPQHLIVFNKPGPNFGRVAELRELALAHRDIYLDLAGKGDIIVGGRIEGEPVLGISVFRQGVDEVAIRKLLADDAIVRAGVIEIEFRHWSIQMGSLGQADAANQ